MSVTKGPLWKKGREPLVNDTDEDPPRVGTPEGVHARHGLRLHFLGGARPPGDTQVERVVPEARISLAPVSESAVTDSPPRLQFLRSQGRDLTSGLVLWRGGGLCRAPRRESRFPRPQLARRRLGMRWGAGSFGSRDVGTEPAETLVAIENLEQSDCENRAAA